MGVKLRFAVPVALLLAAAGVGAAFAATMSSGGTVKAAHSSTLGTLLENASGFTLYHYTPDKQGSVKCTAACATLWPPLTVKAGVKPKAGAGIVQAKLSTVKRPDGTTQVTYGGLTLYRFSGDSKPGSVKGQGVLGTWFAVTSKGTLAKVAAGGSGGGTAPPPPTTTDPGYGNGGY